MNEHAWNLGARERECLMRRSKRLWSTSRRRWGTEGCHHSRAGDMILCGRIVKHAGEDDGMRSIGSDDAQTDVCRKRGCTKEE